MLVGGIALGRRQPHLRWGRKWSAREAAGARAAVGDQVGGMVHPAAGPPPRTLGDQLYPGRGGGRHLTRVAWASPADVSQGLSCLHLPSTELRAWGLAPLTALWAPCPPRAPPPGRPVLGSPAPPASHFPESHCCSPALSATILTGAGAQARLGQAHPHPRPGQRLPGSVPEGLEGSAGFSQATGLVSWSRGAQDKLRLVLWSQAGWSSRLVYFKNYFYF